MLQWEYINKRYEFTADGPGVEEFEDRLNAMGRKGWELASCQRFYDGESGPKHGMWFAYCVFKRPVLLAGEEG